MFSSPAPKQAPMRRQLLSLTILALLIFQQLVLVIPTVSAAGSGSISLTALGVSYSQDFNTLPSTGSASWVNDTTILGWYTARTGTGTTIVADTGSSNAGNLYSYGSTSSTDRALGSVGSGNAAAGNFFWGVRLKNSTGSTINSLDISYTGEQWRNSAAGAQTVSFSYFTGASITGSLADFQATGTNVTALNFTSPITGGTAGAINGNIASNRTVISSTITGLNIADGQEILLRWSDPDHIGNDHGLAIDDFSVVPHHLNQPTNPTITATSATPATLSAGGTTLLTATVSLGSDPTSTGLTVTGDLSSIGGSATQPFFDNATNGDVTAGDNIFSYTATVSGGTTAGAKSLPVTAKDAQLRNSVPASISLTVQPPQLEIHDIQGPGTTSPFAGLTVATTGIVTGIKTGSGFFIQTPDANVDSNPNTSEGVFVFTGSSIPAAAVIGNKVSVTGTAQEFIPSADVNSPPVTEIGGSPSVSVLSIGNTPPAPITLTAADTSPTGSIDQLERFEGMRVHVDSLTAIAPTQGNLSEANATSTTNGTFYGVIRGVARPFREPGVEVPDPLPSGAPANVPRFDANPERLRVDSDAQPGAIALNVTSGAIITNLTGPFDYSFRTYTILQEAATVPSVTGNISAIPVPVATAGEFTVASFNMERFYDTINDSGTSDVVLTGTAFNNRLNKASLAIRNVMRTPDIIGIEEMENLQTLQAVANKVNSDAVAAGDPNPNYQAYLEEGNDIGGIDVGFLVKTPRVNVISVTQVGKTTTYVDPDGGLALLNDRPSLVLVATVQPPSGVAFPVTVIVNHLRSLSGVDDPADGARVRAKRRAQAEFLANYIQSRQSADPNEHIVSVGDYNAFQFNDGYVDSIGTIKGTPTPADQVVLASADLVNPDLTELIHAVPDERYSYSFDGNAQELDHIIITGNLLPRFDSLNYARNDADFPEVYRSDASRPERISDHDMPVAYFSFPNADLSIGKTVTPNPVISGAQLTYTIPVANTMADAALNLSVSDTLPANTTFQSIDKPADWSCSTPSVGDTGTVTCTTPSLASNTSAVLTLVVNVDCATPNNTVINNTATVSSSTFDPDSSNNSTTAMVTVSNPPPVVTAPADASYECLSEVPAAIASDATATDNCNTPTLSVSESNNGGAGSPSSPLIITRVYSATDSSGSTGSDTQTINVIDNTPPTIHLVGDDPMTVECHTTFTDPGATANDNCGAADLTSQITVQGIVNDTVPGTYTLIYSVTDAAGNTSHENRTVNVVDTEPPVLTLVGVNPLVIECHHAFSDPGATALDECDGDLGSKINVTSSVNPNAVGTYSLTYKVSDAAGNQATKIRTVLVVDTESPVPNVAELPDVVGECSASITAAPTATDECAGLITGTTSDPTTYISQGTYTVTWTYNDGHGNTAMQTQRVIVNDTQAPAIGDLSVDKPVLSPPNHKMVDVAVNYVATDNCGPVTTMLSVTSNEPDNGLGDGDTANDIQLVNNHLVRLRAERSGGGTGRVYTITVVATDSHGNMTTRAVIVSVPKGK
jgi:uncharacterized repeat protein (TIGR01451 family)